MGRRPPRVPFGISSDPRPDLGPFDRVPGRPTRPGVRADAEPARLRDADAPTDPAARREPPRDALRRGDAGAGARGGLRDGLSGGGPVGQPRPEAGARPPVPRAG